MGFKQDIARIRVEQGGDNPFDAPDNWRLKAIDAGEEPVPPPHKDWAHAAARGVMADLSDRRTIKSTLAVIEESVRIEVVEALSDIIRHAHDAQAEVEEIHVLYVAPDDVTHIGVDDSDETRPG